MWDRVLGHEGPKKFLKKYLQAQDRPHGLLFLGSRGLGKGLLAREFIKSLLCQHGLGNDNCTSCRLLNFDTGNIAHKDFLQVAIKEGSKTIKVEQIRDLISNGSYGPAMGKYKVCLIEDADKMLPVAANAILKLLEEPPEGWIFILLAESEERLLPTVLSRLVIIRFQPVAEEQVKSFLVGRGLEKDKAAVLARLCEGSPGRALTLEEEQLWQWRQQAQGLLEALPMERPLYYITSRSWLEKAERKQLVLLLELLQLLVRDMLLLKAGQKDVYNSDLVPWLEDKARGWRQKALKQVIELLQEAYLALEASAGMKLVLEALVLKIDRIYKE